MDVCERSESDSVSIGDEGTGSTSTSVRAIGLSVSDLLSAPSQSSAPQDENPKTAVMPDSKTSSTSSSTTPILENRTMSSHAASPRLKRKTAQESSPVSNESAAAYQYTAMQQVIEDRANVEYKLTIREQPKHSRMCGVGEKADRRPIDPAPIIQLRVIVHDHGPPHEEVGKKVKESDEVWPMSQEQQQEDMKSPTTSTSSLSVANARRGTPVRTSWGAGWEDKTWYLENPYYFMYAMLADADTDEELHLLQDGKTRYTTGSCVSCLYHLKDIDGSEQGFFVFPDLSIRVEGRYRLKLCLFETIGHEVYHCRSVYSTPFNVYTAKRFPGMEESTMLSRSFADQGLKVRVRRNPRARRGRMSGKRKDLLESDEDSDEKSPGHVPSVYSHQSDMESIKRLKSNDGQQNWQSNEQQQYQQQRYQQQPRSPHLASYSTQHRPAEYPPQGLPHQYRQSQSSYRERRYTDSFVGPSHITAGEEPYRRGQEYTQSSSGPLGVRYANNPPIQQQHNRTQHSDAYSEEAYRRYFNSSNNQGGGNDSERRDTMMKPNEQSTQHYIYHRQPKVTRGESLAQPLPSGLPGLLMEDYNIRQDKRTVLPPLHHALSSHQQSDQLSMYRDALSRPSTSGASPRSQAAFPKKMPPIPLNGTHFNPRPGA